MRSWGERTWEQLRVSQIMAVRQPWQSGFVHRSVTPTVLCHMGPWGCLGLHHSTSCHCHYYHQHSLWILINAESTANATAKPCTVPNKNLNKLGLNWLHQHRSIVWLRLLKSIIAKGCCTILMEFSWLVFPVFFSPFLVSCQQPGQACCTQGCSSGHPAPEIFHRLLRGQCLGLCLWADICLCSVCTQSVSTVGETGYPKHFYAPACRFFTPGLKHSALLSQKIPD